MTTEETSWPASQTNRRSFFSRLGGWAMAAGAFIGIPGCDTSGDAPEDDFGMHGPAQASDWALKLPEAPSAAPLFAGRAPSW